MHALQKGVEATVAGCSFVLLYIGMGEGYVESLYHGFRMWIVNMRLFQPPITTRMPIIVAETRPRILVIFGFGSEYWVISIQNYHN